MKRFYADVAVTQGADGWHVTLDGRALRTAAGHLQAVPTRDAAELLAAEWAAQGETIDPKSFVLRDLADYAIDVVQPDRAAAIAGLLKYAATDTLCYRADPDEPLYQRQQQLWDPLVASFEQRHGVRLQRVSGVIHRPQEEATFATLASALEAQSAFALAALATLASLAASLVVALAVLESDVEASALYAAANCEEDWQAEQWGWDWQAEDVRAARLAAFEQAAQFLRAVATA